METECAVDQMPGREAETLATQLQNYLDGEEIVPYGSNDRGMR